MEEIRPIVHDDIQDNNFDKDVRDNKKSDDDV